MLFVETISMTTQSERLKSARLKAGLSQQQVADAVGMKQPSYNYLEKNNNSGSAKLTEIAKVLKVDPYWLRTGKTDKDIELEVENILVNSVTAQLNSSGNNQEKIWIDLVNIRFSCGNGESIEFHFDNVVDRLEIPASVFKKYNVKPHNARLVKATGDSQEPYVCNEDVFAIDISDTEVRDGEFYAVYFEGEAMLKQIFKEQGGKLILHSLNNRYRDRIVTEDNGMSFRVIGRQFYRAG